MVRLLFQKYKNTNIKDDALIEEETINKLQNCLARPGEIGNWLVSSGIENFGKFFINNRFSSMLGVRGVREIKF